MNGKYLLDTNIVIDILNGNKIIIEKLASSSEIYSCDIVNGELFYGALGSKHKDINIEKVENFISRSLLVSVNTVTAIRYGTIKNVLKQKGTPIPDNDIWIAALADQYELTVLTRDKHFANVDNVLIEILD